MSHLKEWPGDAIMIVCSTLEEANTYRMARVRPCECRDCGKAIVHDDETRIIADRLESELAASLRPGRELRPVKFFCIACAMTYDRQSIHILRDFR